MISLFETPNGVLKTGKEPGASKKNLKENQKSG